MVNTPQTFRLHIGLFGRRNVGKSSILNALTRQKVSIVSEVAGTTTDPVEKSMELPPLGPVHFIDTAGIDDEGSLGALRIAKTRLALERTDVALLISAQGEWTPYETELLKEFTSRQIPTLIVFNKADLKLPSAEVQATLQGKEWVSLCALKQEGLESLYQALLRCVPEEVVNRPYLAADLVPEGQCAILVTPIDKEAPKGRLILPEVQTIRDLLDGNRLVLVCRESELPLALGKLKEKPALVVTDSQAFKTVSELTPPDIPLTGFSVLFARFQGDLNEMTRGALALHSLRPGDKVLIAEACSHHPIHEDIGTVKIPRLLNRSIGGELHFEWTHGRDFPEDLPSYRLVIHCGACMWNRRAVLSRIIHCQQAGVPITNYGLTLAFALGILERALQPFPEAHKIYKDFVKAHPSPPPQ